MHKDRYLKKIQDDEITGAEHVHASRIASRNLSPELQDDLFTARAQHSLPTIDLRRAVESTKRRSLPSFFSQYRCTITKKFTNKNIKIQMFKPQFYPQFVHFFVLNNIKISY